MPVTQKVLKELFQEIEKLGGKKLWRNDRNASQLLEKGFDEARQVAGYNTANRWGEASGIHYAPDVKDLDALITGRYGGITNGKYRPNVEAMPLPGSRQKEFTAAEWKEQMPKPMTQIIGENKPKYDFITYPDLSEGQPTKFQTVQLNPRQAVAKIKLEDSHTGRFVDNYKILGLGGVGLLAGSMLSPGDADAMPLGKPIKAMGKTFVEAMKDTTTVLGKDMKKAGQLKPAVSSASERLKGMPLRGSRVSGVYQGIGEHRYIHLEDGQIYPTTRNSVHELAAEWGTQQQVGKFKALPEADGARWQQILKSFQMNEQKGIAPRSGGSKPTRIAILENSLTDRQNMLGEENQIADQVLVQSLKSKKWWLWPRAYAEPAEAAGLVRIDKAKNTLFTNKGLK